MIRIVLVDDHPIVRSGIAGLFELEEDLQVVGEAADGTEALAIIERNEPDVVVTDLRMPGMDGRELTERLARDHPGVKVLVLTTYESDDAILTAIEAGAAGYLLKAAPHAEIVAGVRAVAAGQTALSPSVAVALVKSARREESAPVLTEREKEALRHVAQGLSNAAIGRQMHLSEATVKTHLLHAFAKLEVKDRTRAVTKAMELRLI